MVDEKKAARGRPVEGSRPNGRSRLLAAALVNFAEFGYSGANVERILEQAEVTAPTLYHHFGNKARLFVETSIEAYAGVEQRLRREIAPAETFEDALDAMFRASVDMVTEAPTLSDMFLTIQIDIRRNRDIEAELRPVLTRFSLIFDEVAALAPPDVVGPTGDHRILSRTLVSVVNGLTSEALLLRRKEDFPAIVACLRNMILTSHSAAGPAPRS